MSEVASHALVYHYGDSFSGKSVQWKDSAGAAKDLTGYTADMKVRAKTTDGTTGTEVLHLKSSPANGLSIPTPTNGTVVISATPTIMTAGSLAEGVTYDYDLQVKSSDGSIVQTLIKGDFRVDRQVTDV